ncbi:MAG: hypothetical protein HUK22_02180, partial [Thermoguttaceae bacterium]|nr:hypothetical protein [Thermoguttaceae bacterium]
MTSLRRFYRQNAATRIVGASAVIISAAFVVLDASIARAQIAGFASSQRAPQKLQLPTTDAPAKAAAPRSSSSHVVFASPTSSQPTRSAYAAPEPSSSPSGRDLVAGSSHAALPPAPSANFRASIAAAGLPANRGVTTSIVSTRRSSGGVATRLVAEIEDKIDDEPPTLRSV